MRKAPPSERMTAPEFQKWVKDMGYAKRLETARSGPRFKIPYDPAEIAADLGVQVEHVYRFWRGVEKGKELLVSEQITRLCHALLALHQTRKSLEKEIEKHSELAELLGSILKKAQMPAFRKPRTARKAGGEGGKDDSE
jgi:hypothetical protein